jgi:hypothetical protein
MTTMHEYQPQWVRSENSEKRPSLATDRTDTLLAQSETVSSVSADLGANREIFPPELPDPAALVPSLEKGWNWLREHPDHPEHDAFLDRWIARLREYEQVYRSRNGSST